MQPRTAQGFTFTELMIVVALVAILASLAAPNFRNFFEKKRVIGAMEDVYGQLQFARSEALKQSQTIFVNFSGADTTWAAGVSSSSGCDPTVTDATSATACRVDMDRSNPGTSYMLRRTGSSEHPNLTITLPTFSGGNQTSFDPVRGTATASTTNLIFTSASGFQLQLSLGAMGRIEVCSPSGTGNISGYPTCP